MSRSRGQLLTRTRTFQNVSVGRLMEVFTPWLEPAQYLGKPERNRLFSPHENLLAFLEPNLVGGRVVQRNRTPVPGVARVDRR
jgi:hypothetical protein